MKISEHLHRCSRLRTLRFDRNNLHLETIPVNLLTNSTVSLISYEGNRFDEKAFQGKEGYDQVNEEIDIQIDLYLSFSLQYMQRFTASRRKLE